MIPEALTFKLRGNYGRQNNIVFLNGKYLNIMESQIYYNHSTDFAWGYGGQGPSQLAFAILLKLKGLWFAKDHFYDFKWDFIAGLKNESFPETEFTYTFKNGQEAL